MPSRSKLFTLFAIIAAAHAFLGFSLFSALNLEGLALLGAWLVLLLSTALLPMGLLAPMMKNKAVSDRLAWAGLIVMGLFSSVFVLTLLRDLLLLPLSFIVPAHYYQDMNEGSALAVLAGALLFTIVGWFNARRRAAVVDVTVPITDLPAELVGFTIAQISDIHVGATIKRRYLSAIVDKVNSLNPDIIAVTGDLVDGRVAELKSHTSPLKRLHSRHGTYFVTGNHEYYSGALPWIAELRRLGLTVLLNEHVTLQHEGHTVVIAGVTDYTAGHFYAEHASDPVAALRGAPQDAPLKLLLAHQPRSSFKAAEQDYDLQLSGHTHGGQFFPWNFFVRFQQPFTAGLHKIKNLWVYTSRGTGYWGPPKRLGAPSEITRIRLSRA
ncbi:metallophosphoesterase [Undibacterium terreum]|uniref:Ser/threonine protein phosphatase n=1 Tax=Undibacterium terreum TaxID=1224302 RepID=A0A916UT16_9BURK|nr:metallophosphoesterase [Undibacterium terreum]GGC85382.1 ser/threonine protein phosphatase [Undibacterium terreum]